MDAVIAAGVQYATFQEEEKALMTELLIHSQRIKGRGTLRLS
jgi:hypothetical protein